MFLWVCDHPHLPHCVQYDKFGSYRCPPSNAPIAPKGARPLPSLTNAAFEDFSDQKRVASRTSRLIQEASGGTKTERWKKDKTKNKKTHKSRRSTSKRFLEWNWLQICWFTVCRVGTIYHPLFLTSHAHCVCGREILLKRVSMRVRSLDTLTANLGPPLSSEAQREVSKVSNIWTKVLSHSPSCPVDPTRWTDDVKFSKSFCSKFW